MRVEKTKRGLIIAIIVWASKNNPVIHEISDSGTEKCKKKKKMPEPQHMIKGGGREAGHEQ